MTLLAENVQFYINYDFVARIIFVISEVELFLMNLLGVSLRPSFKHFLCRRIGSDLSLKDRELGASYYF